MLLHGMELFGDVLDAFFHYSVVVLEDVNRPVETGKMAIRIFGHHDRITFTCLFMVVINENIVDNAFFGSKDKIFTATCGERLRIIGGKQQGNEIEIMPWTEVFHL